MKKPSFLLALFLLLQGHLTYAQTGGTVTPLSDAQKSFEMMKALAGNWQGPVTVENPSWATDKPLYVTMRVASQGNALIHELKEPNTPEVTIIYLENDQIAMVHYCDFKNRPLMRARPVADGSKIEFEFAEMTGIDAPGHVTHCVFNIIDTAHHTEDWTFSIPGQKPFHAIMDLKRVQ